MIVDPDFLTHWKTQMLVIELGDKAAPLYVIALWAHCQTRRKHSFDSLPPNALKAICRYDGDGEKLKAALLNCGFVRANGPELIVHGWADANAKLLANWNNGKRGGRPPKGNPEEESETHEKPNDNPEVSDKSRVEKKREDIVEREKSARAEFPTAVEVSAHGATRHPPADAKFCDWWWNAMEGSGWMDKENRPIHPKSWRNAFNAAHSGRVHADHQHAARNNRPPQAARPKQPNI